jgi:hypothetical protein
MNFREVTSAGAESKKSAKEEEVRPGQTTPLADQASGRAERCRFVVQGMTPSDCPYAGKRRHKSKAEALSVARHREADEEWTGWLSRLQVPVL